MLEHEGPGHADVMLSLSGDLPGGGKWHRSWVVCECTTDGIQAQLGPAQYESIADAESVLRVAQFVKDDPGRAHFLGDETDGPIAGA